MKQLSAVLVFALLLGVGLLSVMAYNVSAAPTVYLSDDLEGPFNTGNYFRVFGASTCELSTTVSFSPSHSIHLAGYGDGLYNNLPIAGTPDVTISCEVYFTSWPSTLDGQNWLLYSSNTTVHLDLVIGPGGHIYTEDAATSMKNDTGQTLTLNTWNLVTVNVFDHCNWLQLSIDGGPFSAQMWNQIPSTDGYYHLWIQCNGGTDDRYYDDFLITDLVSPTSPPHIISSPLTNIVYGTIYAYFPVADQAGTNWSMTSNATFLSLSSYPAIVGLAASPDGNQNYSYWVHLTFTNPNGVAVQNYTFNVTKITNNNAADAWLSMTPDQSLLATLMAAGVVFILITYLTLRRRSG